MSRDGIDTTDEVNKFINLNGETYFRIIIGQLCKYARNEQGQGGYGFFIRVTSDGRNEFHFHTITYEPKTSNQPSQPSQVVKPPSLQEQALAAAGLPPDTPGDTKLTPEQSQKAAAFLNQKRADMNAGIDINPTNSSTSSTSTKNTNLVPGFTQFRNKNSALIRFTPNWSAVITQIAGGGGTTSAIIDTNSKDCSKYSADLNSNPQKLGSKSNMTVLNPDTYLPKDSKGLKAFNMMITPERSVNQNQAVVQADFSRSAIASSTAILEIFGTPNFYLTQKIAVFIFKPQGDNLVASTDNVHWVSGFFQIIQISDIIKAGKFITIFKLVTEGRGLVAPDKVKSLSSS